MDEFSSIAITMKTDQLQLQLNVIIPCFALLDILIFIYSCVDYICETVNCHVLTVHWVLINHLN